MLTRKLLACLLALLSMSSTGLSQTGYYKLEYELNNSEACVSSCPKQMSGIVDVPATARLEGHEYPVTSIGSCLFCYAFRDCRGIAEVRLPNGIKKIGQESFKGCVRLKKINIPTSVMDIEHSAFRGCENLASIDIPQGISEISFNTFEGCKNLKSVSLPFTVKNIDDYAFEDCVSLTDFQIPQFVTEILRGSFQNCRSLTNIVLPSTLKKIGEKAFCGCNGFTEIVIPLSVEYVWDGAFSQCKNLKRVDLKDCKFGGGNGMFEDCDALENVENLNLSVISRGMFRNCKSLKNISFGENVSCIYPDAFAGTSVDVLNVPASVSNGLEYAEYYNDWKCLKKIVVDSSNKKFCSEDGILYNKNKTKLLRFPVGKKVDEFVLPETVKDIADYAFAGCQELKKLILPKNFSAFGPNSFVDCPNLNIAFK